MRTICAGALASSGSFFCVTDFYTPAAGLFQSSAPRQIPPRDRLCHFGFFGFYLPPRLSGAETVDIAVSIRSERIQLGLL